MPSRKAPSPKPRSSAAVRILWERIRDLTHPDEHLQELGRGQGGELHRGKQRRDTACHARGHIARRDANLAALDERHRLDTEGREGGEAAEEPGEEEEPQLERQEITAFGDADQEARHQAAQDVDDERAERKGPGLGPREHPGADLVARHRADRAAGGDEQHLHFFLPTGQGANYYPSTVTFEPSRQAATNLRRSSPSRPRLAARRLQFSTFTCCGVCCFTSSGLLQSLMKPRRSAPSRWRLSASLVQTSFRACSGVSGRSPLRPFRQSVMKRLRSRALSPFSFAYVLHARRCCCSGVRSSAGIAQA